MKKVFVGMSGGVDSSVSALLLKEQGYDVTGVYMKNWTKDLPGMSCPWEDDFKDAKRVAVQLGIDFRVYDFEKEYFEKVVKYMLDGFRQGLTPNPDIMCNQEIKFKLLLNTASRDGADYIATGHYARVSDGRLLKAKDMAKDQTYFLYRVSGASLKKTIFPLGNLTKPQVRELARKARLATAEKKESMGICFVGKVGIKEFLGQFVKSEPGLIMDTTGKTLGEHDGAIFYTIGQRHGLDVGGGLPYYVVGKDMAKNEVYVTTDLHDHRLWGSDVTLSAMHWIVAPPVKQAKLQVRTRHRSKLVDVKTLNKSSIYWKARLAEDVRALTPGQSAVFYTEEECLGGGIVI